MRYLIFKHRPIEQEPANDVYDCYEAKNSGSSIEAVNEVLKKYPSKLVEGDWVIVFPISSALQAVQWIKIETSEQLVGIAHPEADFLEDTARS